MRPTFGSSLSPTGIAIRCVDLQSMPWRSGHRLMMTMMAMMMMMVHVVGLLVLLLLLKLFFLSDQMRFERNSPNGVRFIDRHLGKLELCLAHRCRCRLMCLQTELRWTGRCRTIATRLRTTTRTTFAARTIPVVLRSLSIASFPERSNTRRSRSPTHCSR